MVGVNWSNIEFVVQCLSYHEDNISLAKALWFKNNFQFLSKIKFSYFFRPLSHFSFTNLLRALLVMVHASDGSVAFPLRPDGPDFQGQPKHVGPLSRRCCVPGPCPRITVLTFFLFLAHLKRFKVPMVRGEVWVGPTHKLGGMGSSHIFRGRIWAGPTHKLSVMGIWVGPSHKLGVMSSSHIFRGRIWVGSTHKLGVRGSSCIVRGGVWIGPTHKLGVMGSSGIFRGGVWIGPTHELRVMGSSHMFRGRIWARPTHKLGVIGSSHIFRGAVWVGPTGCDGQLLYI